ncbi:hypothetical protein [Streptomyces sp. NPDC002078]
MCAAVGTVAGLGYGLLMRGLPKESPAVAAPRTDDAEPEVSAA